MGFLQVGPGERVLDVATGTGLAGREVSTGGGPPGAVVGVDVSMGMLRQARRVSDTSCHYVCADASALPFSAGAFDAVLCVAAVSYFPDPVAVLAQWRRVCRSGAQAVVTVTAFDGVTSARVLRQAAAAEGVPLADPAGPLADPDQRARITAAAGWTCEQVREVVFDQPRADPERAFGFVDSGLAEPLRTASDELRRRVWLRFEALHRAEAAEQHRVLLVRLGAGTPSHSGL